MTDVKPKLGLALTGSFCTIGEVLLLAERLRENFELFPIVSFNVASLGTRFFEQGEIVRRLSLITGRESICTLPDAEPIGPKKLLDALLVAPCTGNTLSKLACGITDTPVTLAAKAHLRNGRPLILAPATNDALAASAKNIGLLLNSKNVFFVPFAQDDAQKKPKSLVSDFTKTEDAVNAALDGRQLQPILA
ncbi:MAG: dipicolinate synthase subunit B [Clostridia bacterium]|nr:dipicolinate synthase subunit B [Clostridia bacterium]